MTMNGNVTTSKGARQSQKQSASGPSGATDRVVEREQKFDEEGGDQPQARSQAAVDRELRQAQADEQQQAARSAESWRGATSMGSEGRAHHDGGTQESPDSYDDGQDRDVEIDRESFRHQAGRHD